MSHLCGLVLAYSFHAMSAIMIATGLIMMGIKPGDKRWEAITLVSLGSLLFGLILAFTGPSIPVSDERWDQYALTIDQHLFGAPSYYLGRVLKGNSALSFIANVSYGSLLTPVRIVIILYFLLLPLKEGWRLTKAFALNIVLAIPIYVLIPISGPAYASHSFPYNMPVGPPHVMYFHSFPNGFPSVHMSTAMLVALALWRWKAGRVFGVIWMALTMLGTLGLGEHYLVDLIASVPYTALIAWLSNIEYEWRPKKAGSIWNVNIPSTIPKRPSSLLE